MIERLIRACDEAVSSLSGAPSIDEVSRLMDGLTPLVTAIRPTREGLPWGRYLLHADPAGRFNLQLDLFSCGYTGSIHGHGTWGAFWVLEGGLWVWDYDLTSSGPRLTRHGLVTPGGGQCFCPPASDWHRVGTSSQGPQTVSIHLYGAGFDLDTGMAIDASGRPASYPRGRWGDLSAVLPWLGPAERQDGREGSSPDRREGISPDRREER